MYVDYAWMHVCAHVCAFNINSVEIGWVKENSADIRYDDILVGFQILYTPNCPVIIMSFLTIITVQV